MVNIFSHYVPGRLIALTAVEALVLVLAAYVGIALHVAGFGVTTGGAGVSIPAQVTVFSIGMMIVLSSMGLYHSDVWNNVQSAGIRLAAAFFAGFVLIVLSTQSHPAVQSRVGPARRFAGGGIGWQRPCSHCISQMEHRERFQVASAGDRHRLAGRKAC